MFNKFSFKDLKPIFISLLLYLLICIIVYLFGSNMLIVHAVTSPKEWNLSGEYFKGGYGGYIYSKNSKQYLSTQSIYEDSSYGAITNSPTDNYHFFSNDTLRTWNQTNNWNVDTSTFIPNQLTLRVYLSNFTDEDFNSLFEGMDNSSQGYEIYLNVLLRGKYYYDLASFSGANNYFSLSRYFENGDFSVSLAKNNSSSLWPITRLYYESSRMLHTEIFDEDYNNPVWVYDDFCGFVVTIPVQYIFSQKSTYILKDDKGYYMELYIKFHDDSDFWKDGEELTWVYPPNSLDSQLSTPPPYIPIFHDRLSTFSVNRSTLTTIRPNKAYSFEDFSQPDDEKDIFYSEHDYKYPEDQDTDLSSGGGSEEEDFLQWLSGLVIPDKEYFQNMFSNIKNALEEKLGILVYPMEIFFGILNRFSNLSNTQNFVINVPNFTIPGFKTPILKAQSYDLMNVFREPTINYIWTLYLDFVDVFLIVSFLNFSWNRLSSFIGSYAPADYDYYSVDDVDTYDNTTGEQLSSRRRYSERHTRRQKRG